MTEKRFTVDSDGKWWDKINHKYVDLDYLFNLVEELDEELDIKKHTINEMVKTIRTYDDGYIDLNKKYKKVVDENEQLKQQIQQDIDDIRLLQSFITDKGYSLQDLKEWEDLKNLMVMWNDRKTM